VLFSPLERAFRRYQRTGSPAALAFVFDRTAEPLARLARHLASSEASAEDLVQATFLTAIEKASLHEPGREVLPWLVGILALHARDARRRSARRLAPPSADEERARDPALEAEERELAAILARSIDALPGTYRPVLALLLAGLDAPEIAARLGRAPGTVRVQLARGLAHLRRALPAGVALGMTSALDARGLARVRTRVLASAQRIPVSLSAAPAVTGVLLMTARTKIAAVAALLAVLLALVPRLRSARARDELAETARAPAELVPASGDDPNAALEGARTVPAERVALARGEPASSELAPPGETRFELELLLLRSALGTPLTDAGVRLARVESGQDLLGAGKEKRTDDQGRARFVGLEAGSYVVHLDRCAGLGVVHVPEERARTLMVPAGCRVAGRVVDPAGNPLAGARVLAHGSLLWPARVAVTDEHGAFEVAELAAYLSLAAEADGFLPSELHELRAEPGARLELELAVRASARRVSGVVLTPDGAPSPLAWVVLQSEARSGASSSPRADAQFTRSSDDGRFAFAAASADPTRVLAIPASSGPLAPGAVVLGGGTREEDVIVPLRRGARVAGRVLDAGASGDEGRALSVRAFPLGTADDLGPLVSWFGQSEAAVDARGDYELAGLAPGSYELVLQSGTRVPLAKNTVELAEDARERWDVRLGDARRLEVRVEPATPPQDAFWGMWMVAVSRVDAHGARELETSSVVPADGRLALPLDGGPYEVALSANLASVHSSRIVLAQRANVWPGDALELALELPSARVRGRIVAAEGATLAGIRVLLRTDDTTPASYVDAVTDEAGRFELAPLPAGHYVLEPGAGERRELDLGAGEERDLGPLLEPGR